jgi:hypothetical protein
MNRHRRITTRFFWLLLRRRPSKATSKRWQLRIDREFRGHHAESYGDKKAFRVLAYFGPLQTQLIFFL